MREKWPVPTKKKLLADIKETDAASRAARLERLEFLLAEFGPPADMMLIGGIGAMFAIQELQSSFLNGNYMATIFCCQTFAEHSLAGGYALSGQDALVESGFKKLIDQSLADGTISTRVAERLHELREMRNPYTHPRVIRKRQSLLDRIVATTGDPHSMAEKDARDAIQILVDFLRHGCPSWTPSKHETNG
ncbi:MAG: hypothetical protein NTZ16_05440 [Verrucomicrobia bacterium]|nr:hypothetical protein [Verrucomicrobiota bacterium]